MKTKLFPIAKITRASGLNGEVGVRPLIRQFDDYVEKPLFIGFDENLARDVKLEKVTVDFFGLLFSAGMENT